MPSQSQQSDIGFMHYGQSGLWQQSSPFYPTNLQFQPAPVVAPPVAAAAVTEEKAVRKKAKKKPSTARKHHLLLPPLSAFTYEFRDNLVFAMEENPDIKKGKGGDIGPFKVAIKAITGSHAKKTYKEHNLKKLKSEQIRQFTLNIGCTRVGSMSTFLVRKEIALPIELGAIYNQVNMPSVRTTSDEKNLNSLMRIINSCFLPSTVDRLIMLNDIKKRTDFEAAHGGGNPVKDFWLEISSLVNDGEDQNISTVLYVEEDARLAGWQAKAKFNLTDFNTQTHKTVKTHMSDLFRSRRMIAESRGDSGTHEDDTWEYCKGKHLKPRVGVLMAPEAIYYFDKCCQKHTDIDNAFTDVLSANLKSDSSQPHGGKEDNKTPSGNKVKEEFLKAIEKTNEEVRNANIQAAAQRAQMIELQKQELEEKSNSMMWKE
jgi:hypothetical protein